MTRIYATARKLRTINVVGQSIVIRGAKGRPSVRTFRNRYALRKFLSEQVAQATKAGFVSVNR